MEIKLSEVLSRELKGKALSSLSKSLKIPKTTLTEWRQGRVPAGKSLVHLRSLSKYLGLTLEQLIFNVADEEHTVISSTTFTDTEACNEYRIFIEKISRNGKPKS